MENIIILNASPRAPKSNSKTYAQIFQKYSKLPTEYFNINKLNHMEICNKIEQFSQVLFVFPLYADSIPVTLLNFLKTLENNPPKNKPVISVLINCGFIEPEQNDTAVKIIQIFCKQNGYVFGSVLKIGSGEAILETPFRFFVSRKIKKLASSLKNKNYGVFKTTMPISKNTFIKASTNYWINYGKKNGVSKEEMQTMKIENN